MTKAELRKTYIEKRGEISEASYLQFNNAIYKQFFSFVDLSFIKVIHSFLPITASKEFNTWLIIDRIRREFPHIQFSIPRINKKTDLLENFYFEGLHQLKANKWGILQPQQGTLTEHEKIDLVIVPLLAIDQTGHRVGYGKGYYDRFLSTCRKDCKKIGVSFFPPIEKIADTNENDFRLNSCLTPKKIYSFD
ncbi:MAG: 5-formyltetrahydrofolate cyclo-ligase [Cyclobacteriaceae bacterium]|nr:5-formyltetrahydrofolate cyclo-ligase [Cyclobacteriaceae bacterium]